MKKLIFTITSIASINTARSQDLLVTNDSARLQTVILEVQSSAIKYNLVKNNGGPSYVIAKSSVAYIIFKNGTSEKYTTNDRGETDLNKYNLDGSRPTHVQEYYRIPKHNQDLEHLYK